MFPLPTPIFRSQKHPCSKGPLPAPGLSTTTWEQRIREGQHTICRVGLEGKIYRQWVTTTLLENPTPWVSGQCVYSCGCPEGEVNMETIENKQFMQRVQAGREKQKDGISGSIPYQTRVRAVTHTLRFRSSGTTPVFRKSSRRVCALIKSLRAVDSSRETL
jgi:hypothetical protein